MATALYRRYRPESFADVIGQEHVTEPLMQALRTGRSTTPNSSAAARLRQDDERAHPGALPQLRAGPTPIPCGTCDSCVALARGGSAVDVIEIDAASHGGVDDARDLRERASYAPAQSRFKIYIIDEAHMVTPQGFNALLKIVEEPPEHVKFVFATTEPEKVIGTIRSRTHHYPFRLVPPAKLTATWTLARPRTSRRAGRAQLGHARRRRLGARLAVAARPAHRRSGSRGPDLRRRRALLGFTDGELLDSTVDALAAGDGAALPPDRQGHRVGHDPRRFVEDLLERLRDSSSWPPPEAAAQVLRGVPEDQLERMRVQQAVLRRRARSRAGRIVNTGLTEMAGARAPAAARADLRPHPPAGRSGEQGTRPPRPPRASPRRWGV